MIILDTNILRSMSLHSSSADLIRALQAAHVAQTACPWVALEELIAQKALGYRKAHEAAVKALSDLESVTPWKAEAQVNSCDEDRHREHWRSQYSHLVNVIETSAEVLRQAVFREANLLAPCKLASGKHKTGSRDAAIWLTAVEYARDHPDETVYFVSANTRDFGDGTSYPPPMDADLEGIEDRFVHLTSLDDVVSRFAEPANVDMPQVEAALMLKESRIAVADLSRSVMPVTGVSNSRVERPCFECSIRTEVTGGLSAAVVQSWITPPEMVLDSVSNVSAYTIGEDVWCTATVRWLFRSFALMEQPTSIVKAGCAWETRVLMTPEKSDSRLTVIGSGVPRPITEEDFARFSGYYMLRTSPSEETPSDRTPLPEGLLEELIEGLRLLVREPKK
ncbi:PIN domain-containing protein [Streptomyces sp. NPDC002540]